MNKTITILIIIASVATIVWSEDLTPVQQCKGENFKDLAQRIKVSPCGKKKCKLTKLTNTTVAFKFTPEKNINTLDNEVYASFGNIPLPFLGVTGTSACPHVTLAETGEVSPCPLQAGKEYLYTNVFYIEPFYPILDLKVHWSLNEGNDKVVCFEVPASIVDAKVSKQN